MRLPTEFIRLPLQFDAARLADEIGRVPESDWRPHPQGHPGNSALPLIAAGGDPANDATRGAMRPTAHLERCPYLRQVLASFGTVLGRSRLMRLDGNSEATAHSDTNYYWLERVRIHVPVVTDPAVRFLCGDRDVHMAPGEAWIFDTWKVHNVLNPNPTRRIHLVSDTVGSSAFWDLVNAAGQPQRAVPFDEDARPELAFEGVNQPVVMSPWEQESLLSRLFADLALSEVAQQGLVDELRSGLDRFRSDWRALWARWGERAEGWTGYRRQLDALNAQLAPFERRLRLPNGADAVEIVRQMVVRPGLNPELASGSQGEVASVARVAPPAPAVAPAVAPVPTVRTARRFDRPLFLVSPPRSGSSLLFETLAQAPGLWTVGGESHAFIEGITELQPARREWSSNRLDAKDATPPIVDRLERAFFDALRDREGNPPPPQASGLRFLEKTPKNALRVPFFAKAFPDASFVYLYRDPRETVSSILDAWKSGRFVTYPKLPGWSAPPWSLVLVPGWRELSGLPLAEIAARQWAATTTQLLDDLETLPPERWAIASYDRLVAEPQAEVDRLCAFAELAWDRPLTAPLPESRHTITSPQPEKWRHNAEALAPVLPLVQAVAERARELFAREPLTRPARPKAFAQAPQRKPDAPPAAAATDPAAFRSVYTEALPELFQRGGFSLLVSTYQSGRVIAVRGDGANLNTHFRAFQSPMGMALGRKNLAIGTMRQVWEYRNQPDVGRKLPPVGRHDACFMPSRCHVTGDIRIHELAYGAKPGAPALADEELWLVNTRFSCLSVLDADHSFVPRWQPRFVSAVTPEDRCHLNGLAMVDGRPRYVTALGETDAPQGWRERKADGGCLVDVESGEIVARGLSMPHSPRWYRDRLWVLESGKGELGVVDLASGQVQTVARFPGFTRGLAFAGPFAFVGLSQVRESNLFGGLPLGERVKEPLCGVWVVDVTKGTAVGFLRFEGRVEEIFDLLLLPGVRYPELVEPDSELTAGAFVLPTSALKTST